MIFIFFQDEIPNFTLKPSDGNPPDDDDDEEALDMDEYEESGLLDADDDVIILIIFFKLANGSRSVIFIQFVVVGLVHGAYFFSIFLPSSFIPRLSSLTYHRWPRYTCNTKNQTVQEPQ